jgi:hypothetical protein
MNGNTSVSLRGNHADFQSNTVSFTQVAFAHPVLSILKMSHPSSFRSPGVISRILIFQSHSGSGFRCSPSVVNLKDCLTQAAFARPVLSPKQLSLARSVGRQELLQEVYVLEHHYLLGLGRPVALQADRTWFKKKEASNQNSL